MKKTFTWILSVLVFTSTLWAQPAQKNLSLLANIPYGDVTSDVAGYVSAGIEYAIIGHAVGTTILNIAVPTAPVVVQEIPNPVANKWHEVDVYQDFAYIGTESGNGLRIIDLSGLPSICTYKDTMIAGMTTQHTIMVSGDRLYVYGANIDNGGASVFSLADPWNPVKIGEYNTRYVHDAYVRGDTCYFSEIYDGFLTMVDMRNPAMPVPLGSVLTPSAFTHNSWLNDAGNICFTTDEVDAAYVTAYDVSDPNNITEIDRYRSSLSNGLAVPHNVKVLNDFLVVAYYKDGVNIVDAARPHNMIEVGYYDTHPDAGGGFDGIWGLECYLPSGNIVACDKSQGVFILSPTYVRACYLEGEVTDITNGNPIPGARITILSSPGQDLADANGDYATGVADAGTYSVLYSKYGYRDSIITVALANGVLTVRDIALTPNAIVSMQVQVLDANTGQPIPNAGVIFLEITNQVKVSYVADANGRVTDNNFMASNYELIAGHWGHVTGSVTANVSATNNNLTISLNKGYYDDFAFDFGWTVSGNATDGMWERGEPIGTPFYTIFANPEEDVVGDFSDECYVTGNTGGDPFDDDVDNGRTVMTSPMMDLSGYTNPWLIFDYWFLTVTGNGGTGFKDSLKITINNGIETKRVWYKRDLQQPVWVTDTVQIASFLPFTSTMQISISCGDILFDQIIEAGIDRLRIEDEAFVATNPGEALQPSLLAYPNPSQGKSYLRYDLLDADAGSIRIMSIDGREQQRIELAQSKGIVSLETALPAGIYFAVLESNGLRLCTQKIIRN
jgi:choice-of-anchor B domain-containing protein